MNSPSVLARRLKGHGQGKIEFTDEVVRMRAGPAPHNRHDTRGTVARIKTRIAAEIALSGE